MQDIIVPLGLFGLVVFMIVRLSDNKFRRYLVDKGLSPEAAQEFFKKPVQDNVPSSLKWGLVLTAVGGAALLGLSMGDAQEEYMIIFMLLGAGIALIVYYFIAAYLGKKQ